MKKLIHMILFVLMCSLMLNTEFSTANASNWLKINDNDSNTVYLDTTSFEYDKEREIVSCWDKILDKEDDSVVKSYSFYNLKDKTIACKMYVVYLADGTVDTKKYNYLDYIPVVPDSIGEKELDLCNYIAGLQEGQVEWSYFNSEVPAHSPSNSDNWVENSIDFIINKHWVTYDSATYSYNKYTNIESFWEKRPGMLFGQDCECYTYYLHNMTTNKYAFVAIENIVDGVPYNSNVFPIAIWHEEKDSYAGEESFVRSRQLFLYQLSLIF